MIEDTSGGIFPEVKNLIFTVSEVPKKAFYPNDGPAYYAFSFKTILEGEEKTFKDRVAIWLCGPIFKALGCTEVKPGHFDVNPTMLLHEKIIASIKHETSKEGKSAGKTFARMYDMRPCSEGDEISF